MSETNNVSLGSGTLYLNGVDVGHLKGNVELTITRTNVDFKPSNMTAAVKRFVVGEEVTLKASMAELNCANFRLAMGHSGAITSDGDFDTVFSYDPASFADHSTAGSSYDAIYFGGRKTQNEVPLEFVHERPDGTKVIIIFYKSTSQGELMLPFAEEEVILYDVTWLALADEDRTAGDQIGMIADEVTTA